MNGVTFAPGERMGPRPGAVSSLLPMPLIGSYPDVRRPSHARHAQPAFTQQASDVVRTESSPNGDSHEYRRRLWV